MVPVQASVSATLQDDGTSVYRVLLYCFAALLLVVLCVGTSGLLGLGNLLETLSGGWLLLSKLSGMRR
jgi:hypothetical protein